MPHYEPIRGTGLSRPADPPFRPYVYGGETEEPPAVKAARERWRHREESIADIGPDPEWYSERAAEDGDEAPELAAVVPPVGLLPVPDPEPEPEVVPLAPAVRCGDCGYPVTAIGHQLTCAPPAPQESAPPAPRCGRCGYLTATIGHKVACGG